MNVCSTDNVDLSDLSPESALGEVIARSGEVCVVDGRLRLRGPAEALDGPITARLRHHRDEVLRILNGRRAVPLSSVQRRLWFLQHLDPSGLGYTFSYAFRLHGRLHPPTLHESLSAVISAHCGLRAGFADMSGTTVQFITDVHPEMTIREAIGADSQRAEQLLRDELIQPFDPARPPLLRVALIRTGKQDWLWGLSVHHLIADGWTCALLLRDLSRAYAGLDPVVAEADYADFVAHDHTRADDSRRLAALEYWGEWLTGLPECEFPLDHPRPTLRTYRGALVTARLNASTMQRLNDLARTERTTPFAVLLSVHAATVAKHTGEDLTVVGTPHANRPSARFHDTAGCFVSTVVLPVDLSGELTFRELVHAVGSSCATAWDHSDFSYEQLVERLAPVRDISRNPLFQNFFAVQDVPTRLDLPGVSVEPMVFDDGITQFDLETHITPASDGSAELRLRYNTDLFDAVTMEGFAQRWQGMAEQLAGEPDRGVHAVSALTDADRATIASANRTDRPDPERWDLDGLFAVQVARVPDHLAVRCDGHTLTYRELDTRIEDLAAVLVQAVPAGARVGILLPRTTDLVAVVLATMRAGACFVPLPPDLPSERLTEVIGRVGLAAIWTSAGTVIEQLPGLLQLHPEDTPPNGPARRKRANDGCQPAYIMHTSGSTGVPKGVEIPDRALVNLLLSIRETPGLQACDVLVAVTNLFFDIALLELLLPLITGASVVIATDDESRDPALLRDLLQRSAATVLQATPSMWRILLDTGWTGQRGMRAWCGGEPLSRDLADRLLSGCEQVWNLYGPTESTIWSACWRVESTGPILVGAPIANTTLHILDRHGVPAPPGVSGELHIAGTGLALGYVGQPELTAERFAPIDTADRGRVFAYRTGDLARLLSDGTVELRGRIDDQMKIRGHRVEPEEIEHTIRAHPHVRDVVVVLTAQQQLVAHVLTEPGVAVTESELSRFAARGLRPVLVPQRFVTHPELPRTANGKLDRARLRAVELPQPVSTGVEEPPRTSDERLVASVYEDILGVRPHRDDSFFGLGGHSLAATRALARLEQICGARIPLHTFMQDASVATVAGHLSTTADDDLLAALALVESMSEQDAVDILDTSDEKADNR